jgi:hypothetical protein
MKKAVCIAAVVLLVGVGAIVAVRSFIAEPVSAQQTELSERKAGELQVKIDAIRKVEKATESRQPATVEISEEELASYVLYALREDIPAKVDSIDVQLFPGAVSADTKMTFGSNPTRNPMIDVLISGTHRLYVKGQLSASGGKGKFTLEEARVDGIPVPIVLIETLIDRYVKPKYPDVKLDEPFSMPWGIEDLTLTTDKASVVY